MEKVCTGGKLFHLYSSMSAEAEGLRVWEKNQRLAWNIVNYCEFIIHNLPQIVKSPQLLKVPLKYVKSTARMRFSMDGFERLCTTQLRKVIHIPAIANCSKWPCEKFFLENPQLYGEISAMVIRLIYQSHTLVVRNILRPQKYRLDRNGGIKYVQREKSFQRLQFSPDTYRDRTIIFVMEEQGSFEARCA